YKAEDGIRDLNVTGVQTCALPILPAIEFIYLTFLKYRCNIKNHITELLKYIPFLFILCIYFMCIQNVFNIETIESKDIENATFRSEERRVGKDGEGLVMSNN